MAKDSSPSPVPKKRKWPRRCLWTLGIFAIFLWALNGPIARKAAHYGIDTALTQQGMEGDCTVKGSLSRGFTISDFSYTGTAGLQNIKLSEVAADYRLFSELITEKKIRSAKLTEAVVVLDLDKFVSKEKEAEGHKKIKDTLKIVRKWVSQPEITLTNIDLTVLKSEEHLAQFTLDQLHHPANGDSYKLTNFQASDGSGLETPKQDVKLTWTEGKVDLTRLEFFPDVAITEAHIDWNTNLKGNGGIQLLSAELAIDIDKTIDAKLTSGELDSESISELFGIELPLSFSLNQLEANAENWLAPMEQWILSLKVDLPKITYQEYQAENTQLNFQQEKAAYSLDLSTLFKASPIACKLEGKWSKPEVSNWWENTEATYSLQCDALANIPELIPALPQPVDLKATAITAQGKVSIQDLTPTHLDISLQAGGMKVGEETLPELKLSGQYINQEKAQVSCTFAQVDDTPIQATAVYRFPDDHYEVDLQISEDQPEWINAILDTFKINLALQSPLEIEWQGTGSSHLTKEQTGTFAINSLLFKAGHGLKFDLKTQAKYDWPKSLKFNSFELREEDFHATAQFEWDGKMIQLHQGEIYKEQKAIANLTADIPYTAEVTSLEKFLEQDTEWFLDLDIQPLDIQKLNEWLQLHEIRQVTDLTGSVAMGIDLHGSPSTPDIKGYAKLENLKGIANKNLAPLHMLGEFSSSNKALSFSGQLLEDKTERATLEATIPFKPLEWVQQSGNLNAILESSTVKGKLNINTLPLDRAARIIPQLEEIKGTLNAEAIISGNLADPQVELDTLINIPKLIIAGDEIDDFTDVQIICKANTDRKVEASLKATINGGLLSADATADLSDFTNPTFAVSAKASHAMVFRNDSISVRANADLTVEGSLEQATISGSAGIVESLFYKDIDILPIGVPSSAVADVELPALNTRRIDIAIPEPFDSWKLDLTLRFDDPLLIRGNIARGEIGGSIKALGTLGDPKLNGVITANKIVARLPFSELRVDKGKIEFKPENGIIPNIDIQGKSTVNNYDTTIFVYGPATNPKTTFTSYPPLAKNDIMTLLATGITASGLSNNTGAATLRAAQLFLAKLKQESGDKRSTQVIEKIIEGVEEFEFNINETDGFTGRKYSSAQVKLNRRFYLAAQIDDNNQTRGLLVYVLRFR